jgi:ATP-dependent DNA helicase RecG
MQKFKSGEFQVLIATTVIEVGIDVPNATVMIIENSENYGLSALHQLRGRIGRGKKQSFCFLLGTPMNDHARQRIATMIKTNNGFEIAQEDLKMRGPGEFMGTQQHGFPEFKAGNIIKDADIIDFAKDFAAGVIDGDASLKKTEHKGLRQLVIEKFGGKLKLINVA